jgi:hypothetical protein
MSGARVSHSPSGPTTPERMSPSGAYVRPQRMTGGFLRRQARQGLHRVRDIKQARIGVDAHGEVQRGVSHRCLGRPRRHAVLAQVGAKGMAQGVEVDGPAMVVLLLDDRQRRARGRIGGSGSLVPCAAQAQPSRRDSMRGVVRHAATGDMISHFLTMAYDDGSPVWTRTPYSPALSPVPFRSGCHESAGGSPKLL